MHERLDELCDALSRGRLTPAEIALIPSEELDALFELGAEYLEAGRDAEATTLFDGLVALHPFVAKYWRAYGIALHRRFELHRARAAYDAALLLEPGVLSTHCYRGEVRFYLGDAEGAHRDLSAAATSTDAVLRERSEELLALLERTEKSLEHVAPPPVAPRGPNVGFRLGDGRPLPLAGSPFDVTEPETSTPQAKPDLSHEETTRTASLPAPRLRARRAAYEGDGTQTAVTRHRRAPTVTARIHTMREATDTALVRARRGAAPAAIARQHDEATDTALVRPRPDARTSPDDAPATASVDTAVVRDRSTAPSEGPPMPMARERSGTAVIPGRRRREVTRTALVRRQEGAALVDDELTEA